MFRSTVWSGLIPVRCPSHKKYHLFKSTRSAKILRILKSWNISNPIMVLWESSWRMWLWARTSCCIIASRFCSIQEEKWAAVGSRIEKNKIDAEESKPRESTQVIVFYCSRKVNCKQDDSWEYLWKQVWNRATKLLCSKLQTIKFEP